MTFGVGNRLLHYIEPFQFIDSPEWYMMQNAFSQHVKTCKPQVDLFLAINNLQLIANRRARRISSFFFVHLYLPFFYNLLFVATRQRLHDPPSIKDRCKHESFWFLSSISCVFSFSCSSFRFPSQQPSRAPCSSWTRINSIKLA